MKKPQPKIGTKTNDLDTIVERYLGQRFNDELGTQIKRALMKPVIRVKQPGHQYNARMQGDRVNVELDAEGVITKIYEG